MPIETVNGVSINYALDGNEAAPVIAFVHGQAFDLSSWDAQIAAFRDRYRILRTDLRGHGGSGLGDVADLRMTHLAADIVGLLDALGIGQVHYVGKSLGGMVGFELALSEAERLRSVTFVATQGAMPAGSDTRMRGNVVKFRAAGETLGSNAQSLLDRYVTEAWRDASPDAYAALRALVATQPVEGYARSTEAILAMDFDSRLEDIHLPTMVIAGERDVPTPPSRMQVYRDRIPGARMAVIPGAGHLPNLEQPDAFNAALAGFLDSL